MKDWKAIAQIVAADIPPADLDRTVAPLNTLEQTFRPLTANLPSDLEPAVVFQIEEERP